MDASELSGFINEVAGDAKLVVVSNREPCLHEKVGRNIKAMRPASGMVTALEPIIKAVGGTWVAHGAGSADRQVVDEKDRILLQGENSRYTLRRVWLTRKEEDGYYYGMANSALWPLCHNVYQRPLFSRENWEAYRMVNIKFRDAVLEEAQGSPAIIFIQDYHLALLPRLLKEARPDLKIIHFWHIPWPNREAFRIFPWGEELLDGLLGNDLLCFHIQYHCNNFLDTVERGIEAKVDYEHFRVFRGGRPTVVRPFPISVDFAQIGRDVHLPQVRKKITAFRKETGVNPPDIKLYVGADRIDYTKGIPERIMAFDRMLERHPDMHGKVALLQLAAPSRTHVSAYRDLNERLDELVDRVNWRHQTDDWTPVHFLRAHHDYYAVLAAYRMADVLLVTSLHDGMNLVAKEFVSARTDNKGVLILSQYTGASRELVEAIQVNPYDLDQLADALRTAFVMDGKEVRRRMKNMRSNLEQNSIYAWGKGIFSEVDKIMRGGEAIS
jgi:trehalose 6-phosphate synthase